VRDSERAQVGALLLKLLDRSSSLDAHDRNIMSMYFADALNLDGDPDNDDE